MFRKYLPYLIGLLVVLTAVLIYKSQDIKRSYRNEVWQGLRRTAAAETSVLTARDMQHLPAPVQKYLAYTGVVGKEKVKHYRIVLDAQMKSDPGEEWKRTRFEQYNFFDAPPTRLFLVSMNMYGLPVWGLDSYIEGKGRMLIKLAGLVTVSDARGEHMDKGEAITLFNDMCLMAPAALIDKRIHWEVIDPLTVKGVFNDGHNQVSALLYFNDQGELINFVTDDRYYTNLDNTYKNVRWSTPVSNYQDINGIRLSTYGEAIWHLPEGDFTYGRVTGIKELEYNCPTFKQG